MLAGEIAGSLEYGSLDVLLGHVGFLGGLNGSPETGIRIQVLPSQSSGHANLLDQPGKHLPTLGVDGRFLVPNRMPL
jgi:hypothetical protein